MKIHEKYLIENMEEKIKKASTLPQKTKIVFNAVKSGKMNLEAFQEVTWKIYNNKL